jgi:hypothetical protein
VRNGTVLGAAGLGIQEDNWSLSEPSVF